MSQPKRPLRCAIYTRKSSEEGLEQSFNSLDAQREACAAYIQSQRHEGWRVQPTQYDDGGYSGGNMERPALKRLLDDIAAQKVDVVVVYKVDRLTRSLADFAKIVDIFDARKVSFVSVTQQFNTTSSMGRLTLNVLLSFAQFEREVTGERIRDKISASKRKGMWMGGRVPLGYELKDRKLVPNAAEAAMVNRIYSRYLELGCVVKLKAELDAAGVASKARVGRTGRRSGGAPYSRGALYKILQNRIYVGEIPHRALAYPGEHQPIVERERWDAVQAKLRMSNQARRDGVNSRAPSMLSGLLYDDRGNRLTPSHAVKKGRRYRYYVSQALIQGRPDLKGAATRLPAHDIEMLVTSRIRELLQTPNAVQDAAGAPADAAGIQKTIIIAAGEYSKAWDSIAPADLRGFLRTIVERVVVHDAQVDISLSRPALRSLLLCRGGVPLTEPAAKYEGEEIHVCLHVEAEVRRRHNQVRLIVPGAAPAASPARPNLSLIKAVARGHAWYQKLLSGTASQAAIAKENSVDNTYVSRLVRCAFLAPDITAAILDGRQPPDLTLDELLDKLSPDWSEQRQAFGFANV